MSDKVYEIITNQILEKLESGVAPWQRPWKGSIFPANAVSKKNYRGINVFLLFFSGYDSQYWLTFNQCKKLGGTVKKGEGATPIVFWKFIEVDDEEAPSGKKKVPLLRYYNVFNIEQCELPEKVLAKLNGNNDNNPIEAAEAICEGYDIQVDHGGARAYYHKTEDRIKLPEMTSFDSSEDYYFVKFHEMGHSTGHKDRLDRNTLVDATYFDDENYSKEELVAEMTACFLAVEAGLDLEDSKQINNSAAYIKHWMEKISKDPKLVVSAAGQAQKAVDLILGKSYEVKNDNS
jgi:antirestriction protein ArdC